MIRTKFPDVPGLTMWGTVKGSYWFYIDGVPYQFHYEWTVTNRPDLEKTIIYLRDKFVITSNTPNDYRIYGEFESLQDAFVFICLL